MRQELKDRLKITGRYRLIEADPSKAPAEYDALLSFLVDHPDPRADGHFSAYSRLLHEYHGKAAVKIGRYRNLVPTVGRSVIAQRLAGTLTFTGTVNYGAIGTGTGAPTNGDTQLGTETYRQVLSSATYANNIAYLSIFIPAGTATGTYSEGGLFIDGSGAANSGQLFSRVLFSPSVAKGVLNSLTLDATLTIN